MNDPAASSGVSSCLLGRHSVLDTESSRVFWIPAFAGMTNSRQAAGNEPQGIQHLLRGKKPVRADDVEFMGVKRGKILDFGPMGSVRREISFQGLVLIPGTFWQTALPETGRESCGGSSRQFYRHHRGNIIV